MKPEQFVDRLNKLVVRDGQGRDRIKSLVTAEMKHSIALGNLRGYAALSDAFKAHFLETVYQLNSDIHRRIISPLAAQHAQFYEKLTHAFRTLRAAEVAAEAGYAPQGLTILRNVYDDCVLTVAVALGHTDFFRLAGIKDQQAPNEADAKRNRKGENWNETTGPSARAGRLAIPAGKRQARRIQSHSGRAVCH